MRDQDDDKLAAVATLVVMVVAIVVVVIVDVGGKEKEHKDNDEELDAVLERGGLWGVYRFKRGLGGRVVGYASYDYVYSRLFYWLGMTVSPWLARLRGG